MAYFDMKLRRAPRVTQPFPSKATGSAYFTNLVCSKEIPRPRYSIPSRICVLFTPALSFLTLGALPITTSSLSPEQPIILAPDRRLLVHMIVADNPPLLY